MNWEKFPVFKWKVSHGHQFICLEKVWNLTSSYSNDKINCFLKKCYFINFYKNFALFFYWIERNFLFSNEKWVMVINSSAQKKVWNLTSLSFKQQKKLCVFFKSFRHICQDQQVWQCMITDFRDAQYKSTHYHVFPLSKIRSKGEPLLPLLTLRDHSYTT